MEIRLTLLKLIINLFVRIYSYIYIYIINSSSRWFARVLRERWWPWKGRRRTLTLGQATPLGVDFNSPFPPPPQKPLRLRLKRRRHGGKERGGGSKRRILIRGYRTISRRIKGAEGSAEPLLDSPPLPLPPKHLTSLPSGSNST